MKALGVEFISEFVVFNTQPEDTSVYIDTVDIRAYVDSAIQLALSSSDEDKPDNIRLRICSNKHNLFGASVRNKVAQEWYSLLSKLAS